MKVTLTRALNLKNKLVGEIEKIKPVISNNNSYLEGERGNYQAKELMPKYKKMIDRLIAIKTEIAKANVKIVDKIYLLAEMKGEISFLRDITTQKRTEYRKEYKGGMKEEEVKIIPIERKVDFEDIQIDEMITELQNNIEKIQDELNAYNYRTEIEIPE